MDLLIDLVRVIMELKAREWELANVSVEEEFYKDLSCRRAETEPDSRDLELRSRTAAGPLQQ